MTRGSLSITPRQIERENLISLLTCFTCYQLEDRATLDCQYKKHIFCSDCAVTGHRFSDCPNKQTKACLNCVKAGRQHKGHSTLTMASPINKALIRKKRDKEEEDKKSKNSQIMQMLQRKLLRLQ